MTFAATLYRLKHAIEERGITRNHNDVMIKRKDLAELIADWQRLDELVRAMYTPICDRAPSGWQCTRLANHKGPCAAIPTKDN